MPGPSAEDQKVYNALRYPDFFPDEFKTWLPRFLRYLSALQVTKTQIPGVMGENFHNVGDVGEVAFTSPWRHYQGGGTVFGKVRYYKDYLGIVHLEGLAETTGTPTASTNIFNLPAGYRPGEAQMLFCQGYTGSYAPTRVDISSTGDVSIANPAVTAFVVNSFISLANIHFRA